MKKEWIKQTVELKFPSIHYRKSSVAPRPPQTEWYGAHFMIIAHVWHCSNDRKLSCACPEWKGTIASGRHALRLVAIVQNAVPFDWDFDSCSTIKT